MEIEEIDDIDPNKVCCLNCKWYDWRTRFCKYNPPIPMQINISGTLVMSAIYPKIAIPDVDMCSKFEK